MAKNRMYEVRQKDKKKQVISGEELRKTTKNRGSLSFATGRYMTEKDRPRKKHWSIDD